MIYDNLKYPNINLHEVDGVIIPFSNQWRKISVNVSGGADSACLVMLLAHLIKDNNYDCEIHVISFVRGWVTKPWQGYISNCVFSKLTEMFPTIVTKRHEYFMSMELEYGATYSNACAVAGQDFSIYTTFHEKLDAIFNATSLNPPFHIDGQINSRSISEDQHDIDELIYLDAYKNFNFFKCCPFVYTRKDWILRQYYTNNALDLLNTTRSCEGTFDNLDFTNYTPGQYVPICNNCFWCKERKWATDLR
jgi:hypothetical protein